MYEVVLQNEVTLFDGTRQNTGRLNVRQPFGRLETRKNFYTVRTTKAWNEIPTEIKELKRHGQFKNAYAKWRDMQN